MNNNIKEISNNLRKFGIEYMGSTNLGYIYLLSGMGVGIYHYSDTQHGTKVGMANVFQSNLFCTTYVVL